MLVNRAVVLAVIVAPISTGAACAAPLPFDTVGKFYADARTILMHRGFSLVDQRAKSPFCLGSMQIICETYPEAGGCAVDAFTPCRFEWKSVDGTRFYIVTQGDNIKRLRVVGLSDE
jgi:hypothetical protein